MPAWRRGQAYTRDWTVVYLAGALLLLAGAFLALAVSNSFGGSRCLQTFSTLDAYWARPAVNASRNRRILANCLTVRIPIWAMIFAMLRAGPGSNRAGLRVRRRAWAPRSTCTAASGSRSVMEF